jgi:hypothetical protein
MRVALAPLNMMGMQLRLYSNRLESMTYGESPRNSLNTTTRHYGSTALMKVIAGNVYAQTAQVNRHSAFIGWGSGAMACEVSL